MSDVEKKNDTTKVISMTQFEFQLELDKVRLGQKAIDDAELARLRKAWEKEAAVNHDAAMAYKQGRHDAIDKACEWLENWAKATEWYTIEESIEMLRKAMEE